MRKLSLTIQANDENGEASDPTTVELVWHSKPVIDNFEINPRIPVLGMPVTVKVNAHHPDGIPFDLSMVTEDEEEAPNVSIQKSEDGKSFLVVVK